MPAHPVPIDVKQQGLTWLQPPYNWSLRQIAAKLDVSPSIVSKWRNELMNEGLLNTESQAKQHSDTWTPEKRFAVIIETATMSEMELAEYCRHKGLFVEQVKQWRAISLQAHETKLPNKHKIDKELREQRKKVKDLERELARKDKALAETAALLVLREKFNALWEHSEED